MMSASSRQRERYLDRATDNLWRKYLDRMTVGVDVSRVPAAYLTDLYHYRHPLGIVEYAQRLLDNNTAGQERFLTFLYGLQTLEPGKLVVYKTLFDRLGRNITRGSSTWDTALQRLEEDGMGAIEDRVYAKPGTEDAHNTLTAAGLRVFLRTLRLLSKTLDRERWWSDAHDRDELCQVLENGELQRLLGYCVLLLQNKPLPVTPIIPEART